jgi:hypothetical protein
MDFFINLSWNILSGSIDQSLIETGIWVILWWMLVIRSIIAIISLIISIFMIIARRKVFQKANLPGRWILIPFYNLYLKFKLWGRPWLRFLWIFFPPVLLILMIILNFDIAKKFKKHRTFWLGLWLLPIVFIPILAFDKNNKYKKQ